LNSELCFSTATELACALAKGDLSAQEVVAAHLQQVERYNDSVNAIVTLVPDRAMAAASEADRARARGHALGPLHGLPIAHKDLSPTAGVRTTYGSTAFAEFVPTEDSLLVERLRAAGAIMIGKTNTPEFGAGSQTYNDVFGATRNPFATDRTCGGSSGGAAVALATGMLPIADGSDLGGSLRNPASFCNVVGLRPTPGRVPTWPSAAPWSPFPVEGPMARTVQDTALLLSAMAGPDPRSPIALSEPGVGFRASLERDFTGVSIAFSSDFHQQFPVQAAIAETVEATAGVFRQLGCRVERALPDFSGADEVFKTLRAWLYAGMCGPLLAKYRDKFKDTLIWNTEAGLRLSTEELRKAENLHAALYHRVRSFMTEYEFLVLPVTQVVPFDVDLPYVNEIEGEPMKTYLDWMRSCYYITATGHPAISVPCGFTGDGLPVGVQIVGRYRDDWGVLQLAYAFQEATQVWKRRPPLCGPQDDQ